MQFNQGFRLKEIINKKGLEYETIYKNIGMTRSMFFRTLKEEQISYERINKILPLIDCSHQDFYRYNMYEEDSPIVKKLKKEIEALKDEILQLHRDAAAERKSVKKTRVVV